MPRGSFAVTWSGVLSCVLLGCVSGLWPAAAVQAQPPGDSLDRDYAAELPRIAPLSPQQALETFQVAAGFRIEQVAAEPLVTDPVAICFDEQGRLFVCEMRGYSENRDERLSRITLLVDQDGDGRFDHSTVFVDGLAWPTALFYWNGGLLVADAPDLFYYRDTDGDGRADQREHLFTGLGTGNVQGLINSFQWGLDNRLYVSLSSSGAMLRRPDAPPEAALTIRGRDLAIDPRTWEVQPVSGGAQHGLSFSDWGDRFVCSNSDHIQQILYEDRYLARNPYLAGPPPRRSIAADGPQADVFRTSPVEPWRIVRTRLRVSGLVPGPVEGGGRPAGYFTSATGITIYRGDAWPRPWQGLAIVGDVGSNLIHRKRLEEHGIPFVARRIDEGTEFVSSRDIWFRPVQFANAPDGTLYVLDMYREVIEHPNSIPPILKRHLDLTSGRDRGRIYRIVPEGFRQPPPVRLANAATPVLVAHLQHPNGWHRDTAARLLYERQDRSAVPLLEELAAASPLPLARLHALYALDGLNALREEVLLPRLEDTHPRLREHAVRLAERLVRRSPAIAQRLMAMQDDPALRVRYQLAFSLGELPSSPQRDQALAAIARRDLDDPYIRLAVLSALGQGAGRVLALLVADPHVADARGGRELVASLAAQIGRQQRPEDLDAVVPAVQKLVAGRSSLAPLVLERLAARPGTPLAQRLEQATGGQARELVRALAAEAAKKAADPNTPLAARLAALDSLRLARWEDHQALLVSLLDPQVPLELQTAALTTMAAYNHPDVAAAILERFPQLGPAVKGRATDVLLSRPAWTLALLEAIEQGRIPSSELDPARLKLLAGHRQKEIRERAAALLAGSQLGRRSDVVEAYRPVLAMSGDAQRGREVFTRHCASCHRLQGVGHEIGPSLAAMKARGPEAILLNVLDPNREVNPQFLTYSVLTTDGRQLTGILAAETATSITLKRADNATDTVLRIDIEQLRSTGLSLMPEGLEKQIDPASMADLIAYLMTAD